MPKTYDELHEILLKKKKDLKRQLTTIESKSSEEGVGYSNHMADAGTDVFEQGRNVGLVRQLSRSLEDVRRALNRFEDGTYGICESCGGIINIPRLEVYPEARYCMPCASRMEGKR